MTTVRDHRDHSLHHNGIYAIASLVKEEEEICATNIDEAGPETSLMEAQVNNASQETKLDKTIV